LWFLLRVALAGPQREKLHSSSRINAGTAEPVRVSPPEAVAYLLELLTEVYGWFTEGFDTADLQEARALLDVLTAG
jgi:hypothetical protein